MIEDLRLGPPLVVGPGEPARMGQLQADVEVVGAAEVVAVGLDQQRAQALECTEVGVIDQELIRIGAAVVADGDRLAPPDHLGAAQAEVLPAAAGQVRRQAVLGAVPALHRQDGKPVADASPPPVVGPCQRRVGPLFDRRVEREVGGDTQPLEGPLKIVGGLERRNSANLHPSNSSGQARSVRPRTPRRPAFAPRFPNNQEPEPPLSPADTTPACRRRPQARSSSHIHRVPDNHSPAARGGVRCLIAIRIDLIEWVKLSSESA